MRFVLTSEMQLCCCAHSFDLSYSKTNLLVNINTHFYGSMIWKFLHSLDIVGLPVK